jgi:hypothetical protein
VADTFEGYRKVRASQLPPAEQERLREVLRKQVTDALITAIRAEPADIDVTKIDVVLEPGQHPEQWRVVGDCSTCSTCQTCATCTTCVTAALAADIPVRVTRELGMTARSRGTPKAPKP